ncbi:MAG: MarR family transcriptional regulator [candidate division Zixibacteria bacterium]|nr:MarR family transcriptional regulator [candidate division Zixibacteria bacterium]
MDSDFHAARPKRLTPSLEDYLEAVFDLGPPARVSSIADYLEVAKASVTQAVRRLVEKGLAESARYGRVSLTAKGRALARKVRRRHDTLVTFLEDVLGVSHATAERDACALEHGLSAETASRLSEYVASSKNKSRRKKRNRK